MAAVPSFADYYSVGVNYTFAKPINDISLDWARRLIDFNTSSSDFCSCGPMDAVLATTKLKGVIGKVQDLRGKKDAGWTGSIVLGAETLGNVIKIALYAHSKGISLGRFWSKKDAKTLKDGLDLATAFICLCDQKDWSQLFSKLYGLVPEKGKGSQAGNWAFVAVIHVVAKKLFNVACLTGATVGLLVRFKPTIVPSVLSKNNVYGAVVLFDTARVVAGLVVGMLGLKFDGVKK